MAIFEFSSSNGFSSFTLNFECRDIKITEIGDGNQSHFYYLVFLPPAFWGEERDMLCEERGYEKCERDYDCDCITTFQGQKCSVV